MSGPNPEGMLWNIPPFPFSLPPCPHCEMGLCSTHSSAGYLTASMEGTSFSLQAPYLPASPVSPNALQAPSSPFDYGYPTTVMPDTFPYTHISPQSLSLTGTEDHGNHHPHGTRPPHLQINTGMLDDFCGPMPPLDSANTDVPSPSFIFQPTPEDQLRMIQISDDSGGYRANVGSDAMKAASRSRRKKQGQGSFLCKYCGDNLTSSHNLKYHTDAHFGIRPYKCPYTGCPFATTAPATAKRHCKTCKYRL